MNWEGTVFGLSIEDWRNISVIFLGLVGLPLAVWRSIVAARQSRTSQAIMRFDQFQRGVVMLGDANPDVMHAGVVIVLEIGSKEPETFGVQAAYVLENFIKRKSFDEEGLRDITNDKRSISIEMQDALVGYINIGTAGGYSIRLWKMALPGADFFIKTLKRATFEKTDLFGATFEEVEFDVVNFEDAKLGKVTFKNCNFVSNISFDGATMQGTRFINCRCGGKIGSIEKILSAHQLASSEIIVDEGFKAHLKAAFLYLRDHLSRARRLL